MRFVMPVFSSRIFLAAGLSLILCALALFALPRLDGVEKGVYIKVRTENNEVMERYISPNSPGFVKSDRLPRHVTGAIITAEDEEFYKHNGVSIVEIMHAAEYDIRHRTLKAGGSTITQQLVKNVYLTRKKTFSRKVIEAVTAVQLEKKLSKKQILDYYLNIAEFGKGIYGIRQAANAYFGKAPEDLTAREAALLAAIMPKPVARGEALKNGTLSKYQMKRVAYLLHRMKKLGYLPPARQKKMEQNTRNSVI